MSAQLAQPSEIVDLSHPLDDNVQIYPGDPPFSCKQVCTIGSDGYSVHALSLGSHTGTHVDAPCHFIGDGKAIDHISLSNFIGSAVVVGLSASGRARDGQALCAKQKIAWKDLEPYASEIKEGAIVLIHTGWNVYWGTPTYFEHPFLAKDAAEGLLKAGVKLVGIDTPSPDETNGPGDWSAHEVLLGGGVVIAENLTNLGMITQGKWSVSLVPLNLAGVDGSPVRAYAYKT